MRITQLRALPVIDPRAAKKVGTVANVFIDPALGRLTALDVEANGTGEIERIPASRIKRVGSHAVMLTDGRESNISSLPVNPEDWIDFDTLHGLAVLGDGGDRIGQLGDVQFNPDTLRVEAYELEVGKLERWFGSGGRIQPEAVLSCSPELMLVRSGKAAEPQPTPMHQAGSPPTGESVEPATSRAA